MKFINILLAILLTIAISPAITSAQENNPFEIPQGTEDNPLLDVKYNIEMEPYFFVGGTDGVLRNLSFRTYICYTAIYADGTTKTGRDLIGNYLGANWSYSFQSLCLEQYLDGEFSDWFQDGNTWSQNRTGSARVFDLSQLTWDWDKEMFLNLKNLSQSKRYLTPVPFHGTCATDDVSFIEHEEPVWTYENYEIFSDYSGYRFFIDKNIALAEAEFCLWHPMVKIHDEANTVVSCTPYEMGTWEMDIENLGSQYGYMETIKWHVIEELLYEGTTYRIELEELVHFTYPTSEEMKQAAREAGYDVP